MAYDNDGHLDANRVQLLTQGLFLSQEEAATLPHHITMDNDDDQERSPRPGRRVVAPQANTTREQSDRGNWNEEEVELLIRLHAERVSFAEITVRTSLRLRLLYTHGYNSLASLSKTESRIETLPWKVAEGLPGEILPHRQGFQRYQLGRISRWYSKRTRREEETQMNQTNTSDRQLCSSPESMTIISSTRCGVSVNPSE